MELKNPEGVEPFLDFSLLFVVCVTSCKREGLWSKFSFASSYYVGSMYLCMHM